MTERGTTRMLLRAALVAALGGLWTLGCANYDNFAKGEDLDAATARQVQNPERSEERTPVEGIGATTAADVTTNYHTNQSTETQREVQKQQREDSLVEIR